jgi:cytochrome c oxidase accessory protein FixG
MRLDKQPASLSKLAKKTAKHAAWGGVALWTGFTFVGYFTPIELLSREIATAALGGWEIFWILFYALATYGNAGWLREQVCKYMCPYARFQSSMFDKDTLIITYDRERGEPRGALRRTPAKGPELGDCIDCTMCVQVCPTGIDIRNGLQYECIGCAACVDACNSVMDKVGFERGLIRYSTDNAMKNSMSLKQLRRRVLRPRVLIYSGILLLIVGVFLGSLLTRTPLKVDVIRDRGSMGREVDDGSIENVYRLQIMNTDEKPHRYRITVSGLDTVRLVSTGEVDLAGTESRAVPVRVQADQGKGQKGSNRIQFEVQSLDAERLQVKEKAVFFVPR